MINKELFTNFCKSANQDQYLKISDKEFCCDICFNYSICDLKNNCNIDIKCENCKKCPGCNLNKNK